MGCAIAMVVTGWMAAASAVAEEAQTQTRAQAPPPHLEGPRTIDLGGGLELDLPAGFWLLEKAEAQRLQRESGDAYQDTVAIVFRETGDWWMSIALSETGHITDDDELDADPLLDALKQGTLRQNAERRRLQKPELFVDGWSELPRYDRARHELLWGVRAHDSGGPVNNQFVHILGRTQDCLALVVAGPDVMAAAMTDARPVIDGLHFRAGKRYQDFDARTDRSSGYGLGALVVGGTGYAVVKSGFLIKLLIALKKLVIVIAVAIGGFFRWLLRRKKKPASPPSELAAQDQPGEAAAPPDVEA